MLAVAGLDGDDASNPPTHDYFFTDASTLLTDAATTQMTVVTETGNWQSVLRIAI